MRLLLEVATSTTPMVVGPWWGRCCVGGQLEPLNLSDPRPNGEHCLIKSDQIRRDDASPDAEMWLNSTPQIGGFLKNGRAACATFAESHITRILQLTWVVAFYTELECDS